MGHDFKMIYLARRNPSVSPEDWPRTWRSHAVFASQFPTIGASFSSVMYCSRVLDPSLDGTAVDLPALASNHDGVAVLSSSTVDALRIEVPPDVRARIDEDELRVFDTYTPEFTFHCRESLVHGGAPGPSAVIQFLARPDGSSAGQFAAAWKAHGERAVREAGASDTVTRYVHNELIDPPPPDYPFDGIAETWFPSTEDALRSLLDGAAASMAERLPAFCDLERSVTLLTSVIHRWPRVA